MLKKSLYFFLLNLFITSLTSLNFKEKALINNHPVSKNEKAALDKIFLSLNYATKSLFEGEETSLSRREIEKLLQKKSFSIVEFRKENNVITKLYLTHSNIPGYIIKAGCDKKNPRNNIVQVVIADKINTIVSDHGRYLKIKRIEKIEKKLYHRIGQPKELLDCNYLILCPKIEPISHKDNLVLAPEILREINNSSRIIFNILQLGTPRPVFYLGPEYLFVTPQKALAIVDTKIQDPKFRDKILDLSLESPNEKEKDFIASHQVSAKEKKALDSIFGNLSSEVEKILYDPSEWNIPLKKVIEIFKKDGFTLHNCKNYPFGYRNDIVLSHEKIPHYYLKMGLKEKTRETISRIIWADEILSFVENPKNNITHVEKIRKKLYHRPGKPHDLLDINYVILSPKKTGLRYDKAPWSDKLDQDLNATIWHVLLSPKIAHPSRGVMFNEFDIAEDNILITHNGKAAFIDTAIFLEGTRDKWLDTAFGWDTAQIPTSQEEMVY